MRKIEIRRQRWAIVLLLALLPWLAVKSFHCHASAPNHSAASHHATGDAHHSGTHDCVLCQFSILPFVKAASPDWQPLAKSNNAPCQMVCPSAYVAHIGIVSLRAPPTLD